MKNRIRKYSSNYSAISEGISFFLNLFSQLIQIVVYKLQRTTEEVKSIDNL